MDLQGLSAIAGQIINDPTIAANATITFQSIISPAGVTQDATGRYVPTPADVEITTLQCYLRQSRPPITERSQEGIDANAIFFAGRLVEPKTFSFPLKANGPITVTINGRTGTMIMDNKMFASPTDEQYGIKTVLGRKVAFYVQFKQGQ